MVYADPTQLHQVVVNLCTNAAHAMSEHGGILTVALVEKELGADGDPRYPGIGAGLFLELVVSDTGIGIAEEVRERLFEPFFTTKNVGEGTGMGLSVVHGIVQSFNGAINVESELGKGSVFRVLLPECHDECQQTGEKIAFADLPRGSEKILLVDDESQVRMPVKAMLESLGYQVFICSNGQDALEMFQKEGDFDLVVTDQTMPGMTGIQLAAKILAVRADMPIVLCTGFSPGMTEKKALAAGIRKYCLKPLVLQDIAVEIRGLLDD